MRFFSLIFNVKIVTRWMVEATWIQCTIFAKVGHSKINSLSGCERNWSVFERIHTERRNRLEYQRLNDLVYVHYNLWLKNWYKCFLSCFEFKFAFTIMNNYMFFFFRFYKKKKKPMIPLTMHALMRLIFE